MYKLLLISRYLWKRRIAWVSLIAVMLCTAMVLIVLSVMGGWLRMFEQSFHGLSGDVVIEGRSLTGFPHYEQMIEEIEKLPIVEAAVPTISTFGLINVDNQRSDGVRVLGYPIDRIGKVNRFPQSLYRQHQLRDDPDASTEFKALAPPATTQPSFKPFLPPEAYNRRVPNSANWNGLIAGAGLLDIKKDSEGKLVGRDPFLYRLPVKLTVVGIGTEDMRADISSRSERPYWIVDDSRTQLWQYDLNTVYVPFEVLQVDLGMDAKPFERVGGGTGVEPARTSEIHVKVKPDVDLMEARDQIEKVVRAVQQQQMQLENGAVAVALKDPMVRTWRQTQAQFLGAVENEISLVTFLFGIISVVAVFLIFCIFYMIVAEKTKDIGIIKSVGATDAGVAGVFLGYGAVLGLVGGIAGVIAGWLVVTYINEIHQWLGKYTGLVIWKPDVYQFDRIPNEVQTSAAIIILAVAIVSSIVGAVVPAYRAAKLNPVEALRWE